MASTTENGENHSDVLTQQTGETPEAPVDKNTAENGEKEAENGDEVSDHMAKLSDDEADLETEKIGSKPNEVVEVVEIEEKVVIETLDEAESSQKDNVTQDDETIDEAIYDKQNKASEKLADETETQTKAALPQDTKEQDEWLDLLGNGLLKKKIVKAGDEGSSRPAAGQEVCIRCEGMLPSGDEVDMNKELKFIIGDGDVITALDLCVPTMLEGEICELDTASRFAYGTLGREDDDEGNVPPDSDVMYTLELLSVKPGPDISSLTEEQRIELGDQKRERGNDLFRREEYSLAVHSYTRALKYLGSSTSEVIVELKVKCWNNISASHLKVQEYIAANKACDSVLEVDPNNVKALFRKGKVLYMQGEYEPALELLRKANSLDPENRLIRRELHIAKQKSGENREKERSMYQRMVSGVRGNATAGVNKTFFTWPVIIGITGIALGGVVAAFLFSRH